MDAVNTPFSDDARFLFSNGPVPIEVPEIPYHIETAANPVLRGPLIAVATAIITSSTWIQGILWKGNKVDELKNIEQLKKYEPRLDPTVAPILRREQAVDNSSLPQPETRKDSTRYYTSADYHALYKAGKLTPSDVVEVLLPQIRRDVTPPGKHSIAFLESRVDYIQTRAKESSQRYQDGRPLGYLDGVPVAVKDELDITGYKRTLGSRLDFSHAEDKTAWCIQMLEQAGAIVVGKTNMHEIGLDTTNNNPNKGTPLNPHNPGYYTGGSSGGSAYATAAGICPITVGTDGGGSIRLPSAFCGIYGLKPTHGRISGTDKSSSVTVYGPMAASIDDLALMYRIMAQPDPHNMRSALFPNPLAELSLQTSSKRKKYLGIYPSWIDRSESNVKSLFDKAISHYTIHQGYEQIEIKIPFIPQGQKGHALTILSESRSTLTSEQISKLTYANQILLTVIGNYASAQDLLAAQRLRDLLMRHLASLWKKYPGMLIVTPTIPFAGSKIEKESDVKKGGYGISDSNRSLRSMEYVYLANFTGNPAISVPMGYVQESGGDLPVGLMAMAEWGSEEQLFNWAKEGQGLLDGGLQKPKRQDAWVDVVAQAMQKSLE